VSSVVISVIIVLAVALGLAERELTTLRPTEQGPPARPTFSAPESTRCRGPPRRHHRSADGGTPIHSAQFEPTRCQKDPIHR
jgi:hypothetical protein